MELFTGNRHIVASVMAAISWYSPLGDLSGIAWAGLKMITARSSAMSPRRNFVLSLPSHAESPGCVSRSEVAMSSASRTIGEFSAQIGIGRNVWEAIWDISFFVAAAGFEPAVSRL